jgi:hypothetical protein
MTLAATRHLTKQRWALDDNELSDRLSEGVRARAACAFVELETTPQYEVLLSALWLDAGGLVAGNSPTDVHIAPAVQARVRSDPAGRPTRSASAVVRLRRFD